MIIFSKRKETRETYIAKYFMMLCKPLLQILRSIGYFRRSINLSLDPMKFRFTPTQITLKKTRTGYWSHSTLWNSLSSWYIPVYIQKDID